MEEAKAKDVSSPKALDALEEKSSAKRTEDEPSEPTRSVDFLFPDSLPDLNPRVVRYRAFRTGPLQGWKAYCSESKPLLLPKLPYMYPITDLQAALDHDIYVLLDKPGRVFFESEITKKRTFSNIWMPKDALIFKDVFGVLAGERIVGMDIQSTSDLSFGELVENWRDQVCRKWNSHNINIFIRATRLTVSVGNWYVPPSQLPAAGWPEHNALHTLNDDVLLSIFSTYRLDDEDNWNLQLRWCKLAHVCRRWRYLIYRSPSHLNLHLLCTNGTPVADMLIHSPPLPLIINYRNRSGTMANEDEGPYFSRSSNGIACAVFSLWLWTTIFRVWNTFLLCNFWPQIYTA
ncbi:hypothetical protein BJV78DRAFT_1209845 [Lactifluus subvellereus]|nr:hypothetical protein BJV78DRAFT_1209845 [Lactifluus subvellereus]